MFHLHIKIVVVLIPSIILTTFHSQDLVLLLLVLIMDIMLNVRLHVYIVEFGDIGLSII
jgi:hypothetical protein